MTFQDLILIFWPEKGFQVWDDDFWEFVAKLEESRYYMYHYPDPNSLSQFLPAMKTMVTLHPVGDIALAESILLEWGNVPKNVPDEHKLTVYLGFQNDWYTRKDFHAILSWSTYLSNILGFPVEVVWLPNDWFDHPGLTPTCNNGEDTLEWMEKQVNCLTPPEQIHYNFLGEQND